MASIKGTTPQPNSLINRNLVDFNPPEFEKIKSTLIKDIDVVARSFCESELTMLHAINTGKAKLGAINDYRGVFCIYIEYLGTQVFKPVHVCHQLINYTVEMKKMPKTITLQKHFHDDAKNFMNVERILQGKKKSH